MSSSASIRADLAAATCSAAALEAHRVLVAELTADVAVAFCKLATARLAIC